MPSRFHGGYWGRRLDVDLSGGKTGVGAIPDGVLSRFLGAKGLAAREVCSRLGQGADPLGEENVVVLASGPFQGTPLPSTGRMAVAAKSPLTGLFLDSYVGGNIGHALKRCGFDIITISGRAENPVYLSVTSDGTEIRDASGLWALGVRETERRIIGAEGKGAECISIGPAGENLVKVACLVSGGRRAAGRGGLGAVFGAKKLKAVVLRGDRAADTAEPEEVGRIAQRVNRRVAKRRKAGEPFFLHGTSSALSYANRTDRLPTKNFAAGEFVGAASIGDEGLKRAFGIRQGACSPCAIACAGELPDTPDGPTEKPEYETLAMLGSNCGISEPEWIVKANDLCNDLGLDTISAGNLIGFVMEKRDGYRFGDGTAVIELLHKMAARKGIGKEMAEGVKRMSERLGTEAVRRAVHVKGLELPAWDPRGKLGHGLAYATADIGGSHLRDSYHTKKVPNEPALPLVEDIVKGQNAVAAINNYILCLFADEDFPAAERREAYRAVTGREMTEAAERAASERVWSLIRWFDAREGLSRKDDALPPRLMDEPLPSGRAKGCTAFVNRDDMERCLDRYYELRGWDARGIPTPSTLKRLDLGQICRRKANGG